MDNVYNSIIFGSLFHDIGKFIQRCENKIRNNFSGRDEVCPIYNNRMSHLHVKFTDGFFDKIFNLDSFKEINSLFNLQNIYFASYHHKPSDCYEWIISKADWYSSGCERSDKEIEEEINQTNYYKIPLISVLSEIQLEYKRNNSLKYKLKEFSPENIVNSAEKEEVSLSRADYSNYFDNFFKDFNGLNKKFVKIKEQDKTFLNYCKALDSILYKYLWCIPSTVKDFPDVSLYDHLIITTAIAVCLYKFHNADNSLNNLEKIKDDSIEKFLILSGDMSGIQKYIFDIKKGQYSAKSLRARSFEIQMLCENIANFILNKFELPLFNKILNAGGRFLLILPNISEVIDGINEIKKEVEEIFLRKYLGEITCNISEPVFVKGEDFLLEKMSELYAKIQKNIEIAKLKKFQKVLISPKSHVISEYYDKFKSNQDLCPLCEKMPVEKDEEFCKKCNLVITIGSKLPKINYIKWKNSLIKFPDLYETSTNDFLSVINKFEFPFNTYFSPYHVPKNDNNEILTFEDISLKAEGVKYLAMFKADVDNLGLIFTIGLGEKKSISRIATLSRFLNSFFAGFLNDFIKKKFPNIYVVFSGGDDVCVIGAWNEIIKFANDFHIEFEKFTGNNPNITISAGIELFHHNLPIRNVAEFSEQALEKSKEGEKNSITVFNTTVNWKEFDDAISKGEILDRWVKDKKISKGMVYRLLKYSRMKKSVDKGFYYNSLWRSHLYYDAERNIKDKSFMEKYLEFSINLLEEKYSEISISYAIYKNREVK